MIPGFASAQAAYDAAEQPNGDACEPCQDNQCDEPCDDCCTDCTNYDG